MADFEHPVVQSSTDREIVRTDVPVAAALLAYGLFGAAAVTALISAGFAVAAPLVGVLGIIGVIVCYVKRDDARGTWLESHFHWLTRTFWWSTFWGVLGAIIFVL